MYAIALQRFRSGISSVASLHDCYSGVYTHTSKLQYICVEVDLHNVVITFTEIHNTIGFLVKKRFYLYTVELITFNQLKV